MRAFLNTRREFLANVGKGMMVASVGAVVAAELGLSPAFAAEFDQPLSFGTLEPLVGLMQDTPPARLQALLVERLRAGVELKTLIAAGALANSRAFGGTDYVGYHAMMALMPAWEMSQQLPQVQRALPVLKVLYRNTDQIQKLGGRANEKLREIQHQREHEQEHARSQGGARKDSRTSDGTDSRASDVTAEQLRELMRKGDMAGAERAFARLADGPLPEAYHSLQFLVQDDIDVHRVVLAWRAWDTLRLTGPEHAHTLLRQSLRHCVDREIDLRREGRSPPSIRKLLPALLDQYKLASKPPGERRADDAWIDEMSHLIHRSGRDEAAEAVAAALADGISAESIGEAMSLAANRLLLCDPGRRSGDGQKPAGSVHGASVGVHASDSANAWRNIARVSDTRNAVASLIVGAYHTAGQHGQNTRGPNPYAEPKRGLIKDSPAELLNKLENAVRAKDQLTASAIAERYGELEQEAAPVFALLLKFAVSEDGALHAEKYYRTVCEEFAATRPAFRWRHMVGLARVTASEYGYPAPGHAEARRLMGAG